jgi:hypothetical protein
LFVRKRIAKKVNNTASAENITGNAYIAFIFSPTVEFSLMPTKLNASRPILVCSSGWYFALVPLGASCVDLYGTSLPSSSILISVPV